MKYLVSCVAVLKIYDVAVEADSEEEAMKLIEDGDEDENIFAKECDFEVDSITVTEVKEDLEN